MKHTNAITITRDKVTLALIAVSVAIIASYYGLLLINALSIHR